MSDARYCCERFAKEASSHQAFVGGGAGLYPAASRPTGQIEQSSDGDWNVLGCCGGGCYVLTEIKFCPWCGERIAFAIRSGEETR